MSQLITKFLYLMRKEPSAVLELNEAVYSIIVLHRNILIILYNFTHLH
jgi:hypothetical protein